MSTSKYKISMEIEGPLGMWSRPDTGATPTSYPIPTWSAAKGIFESIAFFKDAKAWINPKKVEICKRKGAVGGGISFQKYTNNYRGPLKNKSKPNFQFSSLILADVCYRLYAEIEKGSDSPLQHGNNPCHALQAIFERRLRNGQCYKTPTLGWNEFVPSYWGPIRNSDNPMSFQTEVDTAINIDLVSMLRNVFDRKVSGNYQPGYVQAGNAIIKKGEFKYA